MIKTTVHYVKPLSVALLTALSITFSGSVFAVAGKFQFVNGEVQVIDTAGKSRLAQKGGAIDEGETVSSSGNGFAQIKMEDGGFFAVRPDTEFKVDTFQFNGKEDGSEKGVFSLIKGSLRSVTGLIGKKHKDNYKIQTATSTIGIRGSGADVGHNDAIGTAVRTLFGGHSLTSGGKTIITGPGQTALAPPGQAPGYVANFPFNTATAPGGNGQGNKNENNGTAGNSEQKPDEKQGSNKSDKPESLVATGQEVVIPIKDTEGNDYTKNTNASGSPIGGGGGLSDPTGTLGPVGSGGVTLSIVQHTDPVTGFIYTNPEQGVGVVDNSEFFSYTDADGNLVGWKSLYSYSYSGQTTELKDVVKLGSATVVPDGADPVNGVIWGRWTSGWESAYSESHNGGTPTIFHETTVGGLAFITASHITTNTELSNYSTWPLVGGLANVAGNIVGTYSIAPGSFPTALNGFADGGNIVGANATVNFSTGNITSFSVNGSGGAFGVWSANSTGSTLISTFQSWMGVGLSGSCSGGSASTACAGMGTTIAGKAVGAFSGTQAGGIISTVGVEAVNGSNTDRVGGVLYLKR